MELVCGAALMLTMQDSTLRGGARWRDFSVTDNDGRGRSEALNVRFSNAKQDAFE
jgi:hypothetical protein